MPGPVFRRNGAVTLRPVEESDYEFFHRHANHPEVRPGFGGGAPVSADDVADRVEEMADDDEAETFLICAEGDGDDSPDRVGEAFLFDLHEGRGSVEIGYWIAPAHQGNGYATAAAELVVDYCFTERRLHKVNARVLAFNDGSRAVLEKVGFEREGCRREDFYVDTVASETQRADGSAGGASVDGEYVDADLYGILENEWEGLDRSGEAPASEPAEDGR